MDLLKTRPRVEVHGFWHCGPGLEKSSMVATHQSNSILGPFPQTFAQVVKTASSSSTHHLSGPLVSHFSSSAPTSGKERAQATVQLLRAARLK